MSAELKSVAALLLTVFVLLRTLLRSLLAARAALLLVLARTLVLVTHLATTLLALLILATLLLVAALAGLLLLLLLSRLGLATLLSGLATLLLSHCCLQVQFAAGCRMDVAAIGVPRAKVGGMASVGHTGSRCTTCPVVAIYNACRVFTPEGWYVRAACVDVCACFRLTAHGMGIGGMWAIRAVALERSLQKSEGPDPAAARSALQWGVGIRASV
ncbi:hypothetical protein [Cupriavidus pauculus]|uniref:hypothetical protein n=1 Tax=Cupriavidus pauculus TaxID=82633 RepID=UPI0011AEDA6F|nr:hypothetical protein [Cupriavidus pauculus]